MIHYQFDTLDKKDLLTREQIRNKLGISKYAMSKLIDTPNFPIPIKISPRIIRWHKGDIDKWISFRNKKLWT